MRKSFAFLAIFGLVSCSITEPNYGPPISSEMSRQMVAATNSANRAARVERELIEQRDQLLCDFETASSDEARQQIALKLSSTLSQLAHSTVETRLSEDAMTEISVRATKQ